MNKKLIRTAIATSFIALSLTSTHAFANGNQVYIVKKGDTLSSISHSTKVSINALKSLNHLKNDTIQIGQHLILQPIVTAKSAPVTTAPVSAYVVKSGDTLSGIAQKYGTTVPTLKTLNHLQNDTIRIGQVIHIPAVTTPKSAENTGAKNNTPQPANAGKASASTFSYVVKSGDTLSGIAQKYGTTVPTLKTLNHLQNDTIRIGQVIQMPAVSNGTLPKSAGDTSLTTEHSPQPAKVDQPGIPASKLVNKEVLGFTVKYFPTDTSSYNSIKNHPKDITEIATATSSVDGYGNINGLFPNEQIQIASQNEIRPILLVDNQFNNQTAHTLLSSPENRKNMITNLISVLKTNGYKGVNIDFENISASDRNNYTALIREAWTALKPLGFSVSVSVPAKTSDNPVYSWVYGYDYQSIASYVDEMLIMAYDEHYSTGSPGPVASIDWVNNVLNYTQSVVPQNKILLGVADYGYDWAQGLKTKAYTYSGAMNIAQQYHANVVFDNVAKSPHFDYQDANGIQHHVWFENAQSLAYKLDLVNQSGIKGIGIWRLGIEDDQLWSILEGKF